MVHSLNRGPLQLYLGNEVVVHTEPKFRKTENFIPISKNDFHFVLHDIHHFTIRANHSILQTWVRQQPKWRGEPICDCFTGPAKRFLITMPFLPLDMWNLPSYRSKDIKNYFKLSCEMYKLEQFVEVPTIRIAINTWSHPITHIDLCKTKFKRYSDDEKDIFTQSVVDLELDKNRSHLTRVVCTYCPNSMLGCANKRRINREKKKIIINKTFNILHLPNELITKIISHCTKISIANLWLASCKQMRELIKKQSEFKRTPHAIFHHNDFRTAFQCGKLCKEISSISPKEHAMGLYDEIDQGISNLLICEECGIINHPDNITCTNCKNNKLKENLKLQQEPKQQNIWPIKKITSYPFSDFYQTCTNKECTATLKITALGEVTKIWEKLEDRLYVLLDTATQKQPKKILCYQHKLCSRNKRI